jgi:Lamin Tail Domain
MATPTRRSSVLGRILVPAALAAAVLGACSDGQPLAAPGSGALPAPPAKTLAAFDCQGSTSARTLRCRALNPATGGANAVLIGGQGTYVQLSSTNVSYDSGTELFTADLTVQNLMNEAIGTPDGVTPDPQGIQVFFHSGPTVTSGEGDITVDAPTGTFTGQDQPYYAYNEILAKDQVSAAQTWQFQMPPSVETFSFTLYIETDVQYLLVINEVLVNPAGTSMETSGDWFELYNAGTRPVNLQNLVIADSAASGRRPYHLISSPVLVPAGGYVTLGSTTNTTSNGGVTIDYAYGTSLSLVNSLDAVKIARVYGTDTLTIDRTQYASAAISAKDGVSRELKNPALDNSNMDGSNWADASVTAVYGAGGRGTPQAQNSAYTP